MLATYGVSEEEELAVVLARDSLRVERTTDDGRTWRRQPLDVAPVQAVSYVIFDPNGTHIHVSDERRRLHERVRDDGRPRDVDEGRIYFYFFIFIFVFAILILFSAFFANGPVGASLR